jgi:hypothetical protein
LSITQPEPTRLLVRSTGFGPRGARKQLEAIVQKNYFDGLGAPSPLTLIGPPCAQLIPIGNCVQSQVPTTFQFDPGNSTPVIYSGKDQLLKVFQPPIGLTNDPNTTAVRNAVAGFNGKVFGNVANVADELPYWLQNPENLDKTVQLLKEAAQASGTYWPPTSSPPNSGVYGDWTTGTGITFVDRDVELGQEAGGILVVTGKLTLKGGYKFKGIILITGEGGFERTGGGGGPGGSGDGILAGNMIIAPYKAISGGTTWSLQTCMPNPLVTNKLNCFLSPRYQISGGGNSDTMGNSQAVGTGLNGLGNFVKGVAEK